MLISSSQIPQRFLIFPVFYWPGNTVIAASIRVFKHIYVQFLLNLWNVGQQSDIFIIWEIIHSDTCIPQTKFHPDSQKICEVLEMSLKTSANIVPLQLKKKATQVGERLLYTVLWQAWTASGVAAHTVQENVLFSGWDISQHVTWLFRTL